MNKFYNITDIQFDDGYLIVKFDHSKLRVKIGEVSQKLLNASDSERSDYKISPSGYGINWTRLDEDLSINGLIKSAKSVNGYFEEVDINKSEK